MLIYIVIQTIVTPVLFHFDLTTSLVVAVITNVFFCITLADSAGLSCCLTMGAVVTLINTVTLFMFDTLLVHLFWSSIKMNLVNKELH